MLASKTLPTTHHGADTWHISSTSTLWMGKQKYYYLGTDTTVARFLALA